LTLEQKIQIWNAIGTGLAAIATFAAVIVALYLARRAENLREKLRLKIQVGLRDVVVGDGTPITTHLSINAINLGMLKKVP